ncbi:DUF4345 domain-containing protein [filamentous cyanobacterium LEGE 11480]|uniref:DUF4345 domain-containing protein n=1 Tax=Romeriopsis navalis LEGE 11480 TaxID=2777977 RepID=A0A928VRV4_9CYAN|nr:DUF4345 domain-containing protein [Romeriopsis navalis]MBE9031034.1 DUF4345 domain-containing protein [Romeriopsis navalis LEGE 11480]
MKSSLTPIFLFLSGLMLLTVGGASLFVPHLFYAHDGILLGHDPSLLSEIRASGGLLTGSSMVLLMGAVRPVLRSLAVTLSVLVYGSFGLARLLGLAIDGMPSDSLLMAMIVELVVAAIGLVILGRKSEAASTMNNHSGLTTNTYSDQVPSLSD